MGRRTASNKTSTAVLQLRGPTLIVLHKMALIQFHTIVLHKMSLIQFHTVILHKMSLIQYRMLHK